VNEIKNLEIVACDKDHRLKNVDDAVVPLHTCLEMLLLICKMLQGIGFGGYVDVANVAFPFIGTIHFVNARLKDFGKTNTAVTVPLALTTRRDCDE
jgi:hypothetical protein